MYIKGNRAYATEQIAEITNPRLYSKNYECHKYNRKKANQNQTIMDRLGNSLIVPHISLTNLYDDVYDV